MQAAGGTGHVLWDLWDVSLGLYFKGRCAAGEDFVRGALSDCIRISLIETAWLL